MNTIARNLQKINEALKLPAISVDFNKRLNQAAHAGVQDAINKEGAK